MEKGKNIVPTFKEENKQLINNYRLVLFLPICAKVLRPFSTLFLNTLTLTNY